MDAPTFLAQFWGLSFLILGVIFLTRRDNIRLIIKMVADDQMILIMGYVAFLIGVAHVLVMNDWSNATNAILSLIGWMALLKGTIRLAFPSITQEIVKKYDTTPTITISLVVMILLGGYLCVQGFGL